jgi:group II intron reverse transcriptase/maturase
MTKGNSEQPTATGPQKPGQALNGLDRVREAAIRDRHLKFTNLMHHITVDLLKESFQALKRAAKPGVDDVTWQEYAQTADKRLVDLHGRVQSGRYRAQPSKRTYIPKTDGGQRPIGIASLEDKIVQAAAVRVMSAIYEVDFMGFSYGFRPGRNAHNALDALWVALMHGKVNWVLDADIRSFFDKLDHQWMLKIMEHRITDPRMLRLIRKWLRAGVSEDGEWSKTTEGTPQGAVISPLLANIYLHYVLDLWVHEWRKRCATGEVYIVRYADDFVLGFQHRDEAIRCLKELRERLAKYGLELHETKTRLIEFGRFAARDRQRRGQGKPETFNFLGFTHYCSKRKNGSFTVRRKSQASRLRATLKEMRQKLLGARHAPIPTVGKWLRAVVQGYYNYHAIPGNIKALATFRKTVCRAWLYALRQRSHKARNFTWARMQKLIAKWIPEARILHPYPNQRLRVRPKVRAV